MECSLKKFFYTLLTYITMSLMMSMRDPAAHTIHLYVRARRCVTLRGVRNKCVRSSTASVDGRGYLCRRT